MINKYYMAYGSNMNINQMFRLCPTAKIVGTGIIKDYRLVFKRYATIEPDEDGTSVPVVIWEIDDECEFRLDCFEGFPNLYRKEMFEVCMNEDEFITAMAYVINSDAYELPSDNYFKTILYGYTDMDLDSDFLMEAVSYTQEMINR